MSVAWEKDAGYYPKPMLEENKVYACKDDDADFPLEFEAQFCFGGGEYWWVCPQSKREVRVTHFSRGS